MHHIFFIHSSVNGHLGCFQVLVIVNSEAMEECLMWEIMKGREAKETKQKRCPRTVKGVFGVGCR